MKRVDEKIKEIEKKDKNNRLLYIGFIVVIGVFMIFALRTGKKIRNQGETIVSQGDTIAQQLETQKKLNKELEGTITELKQSLRPKEYWNHIKEDNSVESYIEYITNEWGIDKPQGRMVEAYENLHSNNLNVKLEGWIYCGKIRDGKFIDNRSIVVWRDGGKNVEEKSKPKVNDIIKLVRDRNLKTYKKSNLSRSKDEGWRPGTKAFVSEVEQSGIEIRIKIKYY